MPTFIALTTLSGKEAAEALAFGVEKLMPEPTGVGVFEVKEASDIWEVDVYFTAKPNDVGLTVLATAYGAKPFVISELPETDWVAHVCCELAPVHAGRFFVYGCHDDDKIPHGVIPLLIEAAMAFGTGHHGSTQGCLIALDRLEKTGFHAKNCIDIGCGTAVLAIAAAHLWPEKLLASDVDKVATDTAIANIISNGLEGRIDVVTCAGFNHQDLHSQAPYDLVFANILKAPLILLASDMAKFIGNGGYVILSGLLNEQADDVIEAYVKKGFKLINHLKITEWSTLTLQKI